MEIRRTKFQGVLNILSFNRHFYVGGFLALAAIIAILFFLKISPLWFFLVIGGFTYGLLMPLFVSAYVYDFSGYYDFEWLKSQVKDNPQPEQIVNINAGFDETSFILEEKLPSAKLNVFDFYDEELHTEPAIVRARKVTLLYPNTKQCTTSHIEMKDNSVDYVFLLSAAHEIRSHQEKVRFLKECKRICKPNARVITVEHLRDFPNFVAFTIGFTHFFSRKAWFKAFKEAGFSTVEEKKFTPFMSIFNCTLENSI